MKVFRKILSGLAASGLLASAGAIIAAPAAQASTCSSAAWVLELDTPGITAGMTLTGGTLVELNNTATAFCKLSEGTSPHGGFRMYKYQLGGSSLCVAAAEGGYNAFLSVEACANDPSQNFYFDGKALFNEAVEDGDGGLLGCMTASSQSAGDMNYIMPGTGGSFGQYNTCNPVPADGAQTMFSVVKV